ncbi:ABC-type sugar transport system, periplasmic component [Thermoanaerobacter sp. YS13]|uniref:ABC transporter substrate-binding protein n=1 Tax=Thermoanaerobacter sp. YS13 TaxID=1511746 RepID=UPI000575DD1B|nr:sugar ABC transporter substrate-binding protein [Thermoanaerobacter sp. YS13]KHO62708.1 ABC-type sugar transport system, periplasmic component [Thermoanaerobacter sp. YS13]
MIKIFAVKIISLMLVLLLLLSACTPKSSVKQENPQGNKIVTIKFVDVMPSPERDQIYQEIINEFTKVYPNIKVDLETIPWDQAHDKLVALAASKQLPDVIMLHPLWVPEFISAGWVKRIDSYYQHFKYKNDLIPFVKDVMIQKRQKDVYGGIYYLVDTVNVHALYVRSDWFKEAGIPLPKTWNEVFEAAKKLTDPAKNRYGFAYRGARLGFEQIMDYVFTALHGQLYDKDGNCLISTPPAVEAFIRYTDLYKKGYSPKDSINWGYREMVQAFTSGLVGIMNQTSEVIEVCKKNMKEGTWEVIPFPKADDGKIYSSALAFGYAISANSSHPDEAWKFIEFLSSPDINLKYAKGNGFLPIVKQGISDPYFTEGPMKGYYDTLNSPDLVALPDWGYFPQLGEFTESIMDAEVQKYLLGQQSAEETLKKLADYLTKYQKEYMKEHPNIPVPQPFSLR